MPTSRVCTAVLLLLAILCCGFPIVLSQEPGSNPSLAPACSVFRVKWMAVYDKVTCSTRFVYTLTSSSTAPVIKGFEFIGTTPGWNVPLGVPATSGCSKVVFPPLNPGATWSQTYTIAGYVAPIWGRLIIDAPGATCHFQVGLPGPSAACPPSHCVIDEVPNPACKTCAAPCAPGVMVAVSSTPCIMKIKTPAYNGGNPCITSRNVPCSSSCTIGCTLSLEPPQVCTANCATPVATMTRFYRTIVPPQAAGPKCDPALSYVTSVCNTYCPRDCTLATNQLLSSCPPCSAFCNGAIVSASTTRTCEYLTATPSDPGGKPCPDPKFVQTCTTPCPAINCEVDIQNNVKCNKCNAICLPGMSTATSFAPCYFSVKTPAFNGGKPCTTSVNLPCSTSCTAGCLLNLDDSPPCTANCAFPTATMTRYYRTIVTPQAAGAKCDPALSWKEEVCTTSCPKSCELATIQRISSCPKCPATCNGMTPFPTTTVTCAWETARPAEIGGIPCPDNKFVTTCGIKCPINCKMVLDPDVGCQAGCNTPTKTVTRSWRTAISPTNDGEACSTSLPVSKSTCSLQEDQSMVACGGSCLVDGIPADACAIGCSTGNPAPFDTIATYPITIRTPAPNQPPCPTITSSCNCKDCSLGAIPTSVASCDAECTVNDGRYALGSKVYEFPVTKSAIEGGTCSSIRTVPCYKKCDCKYTSSVTDKCTFYATLQTYTPWIAAGSMTATLFGDGRKCSKQVVYGCFSRITPVDCQSTRSCASCTCSTVGKSAFTINEKRVCSTSVIRASQFGGVSCPSNPGATSGTCRRVCPGCEYPATNCGCSWTQSDTVDADSTTLDGYETCKATPLHSVPQFYTDKPLSTPPAFCPTQFEEHRDTPCSTIMQPGDCATSLLSCGPCTITNSLDAEHQTGKRTCIATDERRELAPATCLSKSTIVRECTKTASAEDCYLVEYAEPCKSYSCQPGDKVVSWSVPYTTTTLIPPLNGGTCTEPPVRSTTCSTTCSSAPTSKPEWPIDFLLPEDEVNLFVKENSTAVGMVVGGRAIFCASAKLGESEIGGQLVSFAKKCSSINPALYVKGELMMSGDVKGGAMIVGGTCSPDIRAECARKCGNEIGDRALCPSEVNCTAVAAGLLRLTSSLLALSDPPRTPVVPDPGVPGAVLINWLGGIRAEFVEIKADPTTNAIPVINGFNSNLRSSASIVFFLRGPTVRIENFSLFRFAEIANRIIWVIPDATQVLINDITMYGMIIAMNADVQGNGIINGQVFSKKTTTTPDGESLTINLVPYTGDRFNL